MADITIRNLYVKKCRAEGSDEKGEVNASIPW